MPRELVALGINLSAFHKCAQSMLEGDYIGQLLARVVETQDALIMKVRAYAQRPCVCPRLPPVPTRHSRFAAHAGGTVPTPWAPVALLRLADGAQRVAVHA